ncbi:aldo/keto reductase [Edaphobacillus lindanitolerans]|uniref:Aldo/keto reductase n=1 Tax=Edaphobacillus lindanitolerans TaxID=550447 RepID=A0A1U7PSA6_9BACI|nr:aldo/keto reductase [Edaphobacillus lindanitolerans]SIT90722.1 Aldo/keto reductase [Edaphobacillus lindanitolerans]
MELNLQSTKTLANGVDMPRLGLGVYKMTDPDETLRAIGTALETGYRAIDTAAVYGNEAQVGEAVRASRIPREDLFITSKVWNTDQGYDETLRAFEQSLERLKMDYLDLYLTHWPIEGKFTDTYRAIERLYEEKLIRVPGVSNHHRHHLEEVFATANVKPMVNQIELHPYLSQEELRSFCQEQDIAVTSWSPLARGRLLDEPVITRISEARGKAPAQVVIRWHLQHDLIVIPKSVHPERVAANADVFDFDLTDSEMEEIDGINRFERTGTDPDNMNF